MTNMSERDKLMSLLFEGDASLLNLKVFRSFPVHVGKVAHEEVCAQITSAIEQKRDGTADVSKNFNDTAKKIDVRTLLRS